MRSTNANNNSNSEVLNLETIIPITVKEKKNELHSEFDFIVAG